MRHRLLLGAAALSVLAIAACEDHNTAGNGDTKDQVVTAEPAVHPSPPSPVQGSRRRSITNAPAELTAIRANMSRRPRWDMLRSKPAGLRSCVRVREVKKFAQEMIDAHTKTSDDLKARLVRAGLIVEMPTMLDSEHQRKFDDLKAASV